MDKYINQWQQRAQQSGGNAVASGQVVKKKPGKQQKLQDLAKVHILQSSSRNPRLEDVVQIRSALEQAVSSMDEAELEHQLQRLACYELTHELLVESQIGPVVRQLRESSQEKIARLASNIVDKLRKVVKRQVKVQMVNPVPRLPITSAASRGRHPAAPTAASSAAPAAPAQSHPLGPAAPTAHQHWTPPWGTSRTNGAPPAPAQSPTLGPVASLGGAGGVGLASGSFSNNPSRDGYVTTHDAGPRGTTSGMGGRGTPGSMDSSSWGALQGTSATAAASQGSQLHPHGQAVYGSLPLAAAAAAAQSGGVGEVSHERGVQEQGMLALPLDQESRQGWAQQQQQQQYGHVQLHQQADQEGRLQWSLQQQQQQQQQQYGHVQLCQQVDQENYSLQWGLQQQRQWQQQQQQQLLPPEATGSHHGSNTSGFDGMGSAWASAGTHGPGQGAPTSLSSDTMLLRGQQQQQQQQQLPQTVHAMWQGSVPTRLPGQDQGQQEASQPQHGNAGSTHNWGKSTSSAHGVQGKWMNRKKVPGKVIVVD